MVHWEKSKEEEREKLKGDLFLLLLLTLPVTLPLLSVFFLVSVLPFIFNFVGGLS